MSATGGTTKSVLKWVSLSLLTLQTASNVLLLRYVKTRGGNHFVDTTVVVSTELLKFIVSFLMVTWEEGGPINAIRRIIERVIFRPLDTLLVAVPAACYSIQNNLTLVGIGNLDAATFSITYQLKILATAVFSVLMLKKRVTRLQWFALLLLMAGVATVQLDQMKGSGQSGKQRSHHNPLTGFVSIVIASISSGFSGVFFEKQLKGSDTSLWIRNIQMSLIGMIAGSAAMFIYDGTAILNNGFFHGYDSLVFVCICSNALGGMIVANVVKYADNILKGFASSFAIVLSCLAAVLFFSVELSGVFVIGASLVTAAIVLYNYAGLSPTPSRPKED